MNLCVVFNHDVYVLAGKAAPWWEIGDAFLGQAAHDMCQLRHTFFPCFLNELWLGNKKDKPQVKACLISPFNGTLQSMQDNLVYTLTTVHVYEEMSNALLVLVYSIGVKW